MIPGVTLKNRLPVRGEARGIPTRLCPAVLRSLADGRRFGLLPRCVPLPYYLNTDATIATHVVQLFGHGEYRPWEHMVFNLGAMLERAPLSDEWLVLPRLSAHRHLDDHQTLRAIYASGSRQPSIYENQGQAVIRGVNVR